MSENSSSGNLIGMSANRPWCSNTLVCNLKNQARSKVTKLANSIKIFKVIKAKRQLWRAEQELHKAEYWAIKRQMKVQILKIEHDKTTDRDNKIWNSFHTRNNSRYWDSPD